MVGERLSSSGTRLDVCSPVQLAEQATACTKTSTESVHRALKSVSRQSLLGKNVYMKMLSQKQASITS